jgi:hypothetical protein
MLGKANGFTGLSLSVTHTGTICDAT